MRSENLDQDILCLFNSKDAVTCSSYGEASFEYAVLKENSTSWNVSGYGWKPPHRVLE